jgi:putative iron-regulated protein
MSTKTLKWAGRTAVVWVAAVGGFACGGDDGGSDDASLADAIATYAEGVHASYQASLTSAQEMDVAIDTFVAAPTAETLQAAKDAWLAARDDYGPTEAFRFYGGPIDNETDGPEGLINAWPMDEAYVDYVEGDPEAGIINDVAGYPTIDAAVLTEANERDGETNISTGWHAIEFLLWGQDLSADGPGARPVEDYTTNPNADRRAAYLAAASDLLLEHLQGLVDAWAPDADNYRSEFLALDEVEAGRMIITGIGELSRGELAGERMNVAYSERSQEDEHSCFSDNTTSDIVANAVGIQNVLIASYPGGVTGTSLLDVFAAEDEDLAERLRAEVDASVAAARAIPAPFDQHLAEGVADSEPGRQAILTTMNDLSTQTDTIVEAAKAIGIEISVS